MQIRKTRILLADDHSILRKGVKVLIDAQSDLEVVGEAETGWEAISEALRLKPEVVVIDVSMPELNGIEGTRQICHELPLTKVICLSMHRDAMYVREVLRAGAMGYLLKDSNEEDLIRAIRSVARGEAFLSPAVSNAILTDYRKHVTNPVDSLTSREREILTLIADGKGNKEIANVLNLSVYTVETHRSSILEKLELHNTGDVVRFAMRNGLIS